MSGAKIQNIIIYDDKIVEILVRCPYCNNKNMHNITHAVTHTNNILNIDFIKLGNRMCDNIKCLNDYNLS